LREAIATVNKCRKREQDNFYEYAYIVFIPYYGDMVSGYSSQLPNKKRHSPAATATYCFPPTRKVMGLALILPPV
jgi:hypothetical protein